MDSRTDGGLDDTKGMDVVESSPDAPLIPKAQAWLAGAIGAAVALSVGDFADRLSDSLISLVVGVADFLVDIPPADVVAQSTCLLQRARCLVFDFSHVFKIS